MLLRPVTCGSRPSPGRANNSDIGIFNLRLTCWSLSYDSVRRPFSTLDRVENGIPECLLISLRVQPNRSRKARMIVPRLGALSFKATFPSPHLTFFQSGYLHPA